MMVEAMASEVCRIEVPEGWTGTQLREATKTESAMFRRFEMMTYPDRYGHVEEEDKR
jgi:hypothetical protein